MFNVSWSTNANFLIVGGILQHRLRYFVGLVGMIWLVRLIYWQSFVVTVKHAIPKGI